MSVDDWIQSPRSQRIWLEDSMMALGQFAFIAPIHRVKHWNPTTKRRNKCWAKEGECVFCKNGTPKINEFTYGLYVSEKKEIKYLTLTVASHTIAQRLFSTLIESGTNPTDLVFKFQKGKVTTSFGRSANGYIIEPTETEAFVAEKFRPSLTNSEEQSHVWVVPEEVVEYLKDKNGEPMCNGDEYMSSKPQYTLAYVRLLNSYVDEH